MAFLLCWSVLFYDTTVNSFGYEDSVLRAVIALLFMSVDVTRQVVGSRDPVERPKHPGNSFSCGVQYLPGFAGDADEPVYYVSLGVCVNKDLADLCVLQAATFEECIFRAFPVGAAVWYGRRRATLAARPRLLLFAAFAAQVVVFAGAHANYPGQVWGVAHVQVMRRAFPPTYTSHAACVRSSGGADGAVCRAWINVFTVCMLGLTRRCAIRPLLTCCGDRHGLFAPVVAHFVYDLVWVAMPLFLVVGRSEFAVWAGQALVVALGMLPLAVCVWQRLRQRERDSGSTTENAAYLPPTATADTPAPRSIMASNQAPTARASRLLAVAAVGAVGLLVCFGVGHPTDVPQVRISRSAAILRASDAIGTAAV